METCLGPKPRNACMPVFGVLMQGILAYLGLFKGFPLFREIGVSVTPEPITGAWRVARGAGLARSAGDVTLLQLDPLSPNPEP